MEPEQPSPVEEPLQFDVAEQPDAGTGPTGVPCTSCHVPVTGYYYQLNGHVLCVPCREQLVASLAAQGGIVGLLKAILFGTIAAAVGAGLYFAILKLTGYEFALIAIVVGLMVGAAVKAGAGRRGGWPCQVIAVILTYAAIACTYAPMIYEGMTEGATDSIKEYLATASNPAEAGAQVARIATVSASGEIRFSPEQKLRLLWFSIRLALRWPIMNVDIIKYIILAVGLYEAWKINKRPKFEITGPYAVASATAAGVASAP